MEYLKLVKYPGAKYTILPEIQRVFEESGAKLFVDVFGGSGTVSLNVAAVSTVYNDINNELCNLFKVLKTNGKMFSDTLQDFLDRIRKENGNDGPRKLNKLIRERGGHILLETLETSRGKYSGIPDDEERFRISLDAFFRMRTSFGGMGETYGTNREKSPFVSLEKAIPIITEVSRITDHWEIENLDFRDLVKKYDDAGAFFYMDPPYPGKDWYDSSFTRQDFGDLKKIIDSIRGRYLLTLDSRDEWLREIFGRPHFVRSYFNRNSEQDGKTPKRRILFYTNV